MVERTPCPEYLDQAEWEEFTSLRSKQETEELSEDERRRWGRLHLKYVAWLDSQEAARGRRRKRWERIGRIVFAVPLTLIVAIMAWLMAIGYADKRDRRIAAEAKAKIVSLCPSCEPSCSPGPPSPMFGGGFEEHRSYAWFPFPAPTSTECDLLFAPSPRTPLDGIDYVLVEGTTLIAYACEKHEIGPEDGVSAEIRRADGTSVPMTGISIGNCAESARFEVPTDN